MSIRIMKKKVDSKSKRTTIEIMNEQEDPRRPHQLLFEDDFAQKLETIRQRYGSLAKFLKAQKSRSPRRESEECLLGKRPVSTTT
jgi:hypothetical protein